LLDALKRLDEEFEQKNWVDYTFECGVNLLTEKFGKNWRENPCNMQMYSLLNSECKRKCVFPFLIDVIRDLINPMTRVIDYDVKRLFNTCWNEVLKIPKEKNFLSDASNIQLKVQMLCEYTRQKIFLKERNDHFELSRIFVT
jgi:hypothetical protein